MWTPVKIKIEHLYPEYFAPYGHVIHTPDERMPDKVKGHCVSGEKQAFAEITGERKDGDGWYSANENRTPLSEGRTTAMLKSQMHR